MYIVLHVCSHVILHTIIFMTVLIDGEINVLVTCLTVVQTWCP